MSSESFTCVIEDCRFLVLIWELGIGFELGLIDRRQIFDRSLRLVWPQSYAVYQLGMVRPHFPDEIVLICAVLFDPIQGDSHVQVPRIR